MRREMRDFAVVHCDREGCDSGLNFKTWEAVIRRMERDGWISSVVYVGGGDERLDFCSAQCINQWITDTFAVVRTSDSIRKLTPEQLMFYIATGIKIPPNVQMPDRDIDWSSIPGWRG